MPFSTRHTTSHVFFIMPGDLPLRDGPDLGLSIHGRSRVDGLRRMLVNTYGLPRTVYSRSDNPSWETALLIANEQPVQLLDRHLGPAQNFNLLRHNMRTNFAFVSAGKTMENMIRHLTHAERPLEVGDALVVPINMHGQMLRHAKPQIVNGHGCYTC